MRRVRRTLDPHIAAAAATPGADRYRKRFTTQAHLWIVLLHVWSGSPSLRQTLARLLGALHWWRGWGMDGPISLSQLARSSTSRPAACAETLLATALTQARRVGGTDRQWRWLQRAVAIDSTFIRLSARLSPWSCYGRATPGVRVQTSLDLLGRLPSRLCLALAALNDHEALRALDLTDLAGWTVLIDRGYYGHRQFARLRAAGVHVVAALSAQASYRVMHQHRVPAGLTPDGDTILADYTVVLGSANNRAGAVLPGLRLVAYRSARGTLGWLVTDRHDLVATEVVALYRLRWQIELFFRWLKRQLGAIRPLGHSPEAVWLTIVMAVAGALLALLTQHAPPGMSRIALAQLLGMLILISTLLMHLGLAASIDDLPDD
jgi:hypothetical protein